MGTNWPWSKLIGIANQAPTCERCWHAIATWIGGPYYRNVCDKCQKRDDQVKFDSARKAGRVDAGEYWTNQRYEDALFAKENRSE